GQFEAVGSSKTCRVDVRILSATNADLEQDVAQGRFRQDLLYRLNTVEIIVPPLRDRKDDIPLLATHFLRRYVVRYRKQITGFDSASMQSLLNYPWPGNVRELDHTVERSVLMAQGQVVQTSDLAQEQKYEDSPRFEEMTLEEMESWLIKTTIARLSGDISQTAKALGLSRSALYRRLEKYKI
ncbi:sigma 54-interacting transcriptional regulator, partial [Planctomycetota bacterium]